MIFKAEVESQLGKTIKVLISDRGGEYTSIAMSSFCEEIGIVYEFSAPYTPESNRIAERKNRTLIDMVNAILSSSSVPENLWEEALLSACFILNRIPFKGRSHTPYEFWKGKSPQLNYFKVWGCLAKVKSLILKLES